MENTLTQILDLSHALGDPAHDWVILGEGNTSALLSDAAPAEEAFLVKASGSRLETLTAEQVAKVRFGPLLDAVESTEDLPDAAIKDLLLSACAAEGSLSGNRPMPSVETLLHAFLLTQDGVRFVGHTHVTSINGLTCSERGWAILREGRRLFPDEVVLCGAVSCCVPYADPGLPLARVLRREVLSYTDKYGFSPKTIYLQNHGFVALGGTASEVTQITQMADKAARTLTAALAFGEPTFLSPEAVARIDGRPDEHFRRKALGLT